MDYISGKVTMMVGEASSRVNETRRKWQLQRDSKQQETDLNEIQSTSAIGEQQQQHRLRREYEQAAIVSPLAGGIPFGGDTFTQTNVLRQQPPPIGFRTDSSLDKSTPDAITSSQPTAQVEAPADGLAATRRPELVGDSDESLYKGDAWARLWFQRVMILSLLRLLLFVRKVYEDFQATKIYQSLGQTGHFLIAATTLLLPTVVFTIYRVSRYLQITLPPLRVTKQSQQPYPRSQTAATTTDKKPADLNKRARFGAVVRAAGVDDDEAQMRRALMSSPVQSNRESMRPGERAETPPATQASAPPTDDNEGLVTARQTPTNPDEFHDSKSEQAPSPEHEKPPASEQEVPVAPMRTLRLKSTSARAEAGPPLESVQIEKLLPRPGADRETTRVVTGASEQMLHGVLFVFWQLKRQVDVMGYLVERACLWRKPAEREKEELDRLRTGSDGLEWFQDFYAAFLAILAQVYTLGLHLSGNESAARSSNASQLGAATSGLSGSDAGGDLSISNSARVFSNFVGSQAVAGNTLASKDVLIISELIVSTAVVLSLLIAVRRRDDGPMTFVLSLVGWGSLFAARIIIIALSFVHLGWHLMLPLVVVHVLVITSWTYSIALDSHNDRPSERLDESRWDEETAIEVTNQLQMEEVQLNEDNVTSSQQVSAPRASQKQTQSSGSVNETSKWSFMEHVVLLAQILSLFAIPSLFYWPIMFNLKLHFRPFKYLVLILIENFSLITGIWFSIAEMNATAGQLYLLGFVGGSSIVGFIFISLYIMCKPDLTEYFAQADMQFNQAEKSGIYYEFCSRVFKMPDLSKQTFRRLMNQSEVVEEVAE